MRAVRKSTSSVVWFTQRVELFRHLSNSAHRETFESAHSVMLAIFAAHAQKPRTGVTSVSDTTTVTHDHLAFAEQIVPFYTQCLIEVCHYTLARCTFSLAK